MSGRADYTIQTLLVQEEVTNNIGAVSLLGSTRVDTIIDAESIGAGANTGFINLGITSESEAWVLVNIDQQPWSMQTQYPWVSSGGTDASFFPKRSGVATAYSNIIIPAVSLLLGMPVSTDIGLTAPANMQEALALAWAWSVGGSSVKIINSSALTATITVRIYRVWRTN